MITTSIKTKLEVMANVTVILVALSVGGVVLARYASSYHAPRSVAAGDRLANLPGLDWSQHRRTLVLALNTGCHFCEDSVPFYQKLAQAQRPGASDPELVAVFPNEPEAVRQFIERDNLSLRSMSGVPFEKIGVEATPTLILVNREGKVEQAWVGLLTSRQEMDLLKLASGSGQ